MERERGGLIMHTTIQIKNVSKSFGTHTVLDDVSLTCESGKIYGIIGYNGSGKSVLFKCICGLYHVDAGDIYIRGKQLGKDMDMIENAGAIMEEQDILILDEPMNGLDKEGVAQMRELFLKFKEEGKTLLFASHNREDIEILCDEVYEMEQGKLV